jgi:hypothetical protein
MNPRLDPRPTQILATRTTTRLPTVAVIMPVATLVNARLTRIGRALPLALQERPPMRRRALQPQ